MAADAIALSNSLAELIWTLLPDVASVEQIGARGTIRIAFRDGTVAYVEVEIRGR